MKDINGKVLEVGDIVVNGERQGSGSGRLVIREVTGFEGDRPIMRGRSGTRAYRGSHDLLVLPKSYANLVGWSRWAH